MSELTLVYSKSKINKGIVLGLILITAVITMALIGPSLSSHNYYEMDLAVKNESPSSQYWFGTDDLGRDLFTRVCYGARISLCVGISAALVDMLIGVLWGAVAAFAGGWGDEILMRIADILYSLPYLLVIIILKMILGSGLVSIILAISLFGWMTMARIVRGQILHLKKQEFVLAAKALGAPSSRILFLHLIPNALGPILVTLTLTIPAAIFAEAFLGFLGLGVQAPIPSWGTMASDGLSALEYYPWRLFFPALFICITMLAFNLVGEGLREIVDPQG